MAAQLKTHDCPGMCGRIDIPNHLFACPPCWGRLPRDLRAAIMATRHLPIVRPARRLAITDALDWYRENAAPAGGAR